MSRLPAPDAMWREWVNRLKNAMPTKHPCCVRRVQLGNYFGSTDQSPSGRITVVVKSNAPRELQGDALVHEYAHALWFDTYGQVWPREHEDADRVVRILENEGWDCASVLQILCAGTPTAYRVCKMSRPGSSTMGDTARITVCINQKLGENESKSESVKQIARAMDLARYRNHDPEWGRLYSAVYNIFLGDDV
jgi:hypothetical protein